MFSAPSANHPSPGCNWFHTILVYLGHFRSQQMVLNGSMDFPCQFSPFPHSSTLRDCFYQSCSRLSHLLRKPHFFGTVSDPSPQNMTQNISSWMRSQLAIHFSDYPQASVVLPVLTGVHAKCLMVFLPVMVGGSGCVFSHLSNDFFKAERCVLFPWHRVPHSEWWGLTETSSLVLYPRNIALCQLHAGSVLSPSAYQVVVLCYLIKLISGMGGQQRYKVRGTRAHLELRKREVKEVRKGVGRER